MAQRRSLSQLAPALLVTGVLLSGTVAFTAANSVAGSRISDRLIAQGVNDVKPPECDGITLSAIVSGNVLVTGTDANELVLGGIGLDTIDGGGGDDCIVGGGGDDSLIGGPGNDVCIGGEGLDVIDPTCETQIQ